MLHTFTHTRSPFLLYSHVAIAFNGGKDVTVVMHLLGAYVAMHPVSVASHIRHGLCACANLIFLGGFSPVCNKCMFI